MLRHRYFRRSESSLVSSLTELLGPGESYYIPVHEAGHCLVMHCLGQRIDKVRLFKNDKSLGRTYPVDVKLVTKPVFMGGMVAEMNIGIDWKLEHFATDMERIHHVPGDPDIARPIVAGNADALKALAREFADLMGAWVEGTRVHEILEQAGCAFGWEI